MSKTTRGMDAALAQLFIEARQKGLRGQDAVVGDILDRLHSITRLEVEDAIARSLVNFHAARSDGRTESETKADFVRRMMGQSA